MLLVSACDKLHNARAIVSDLRAIGSALWDRFSEKDPGAQICYYESLAAAYSGKVPDALSDELDRAITDMRSLAPVKYMRAEGSDGQLSAPGGDTTAKRERIVNGYSRRSTCLSPATSISSLRTPEGPPMRRMARACRSCCTSPDSLKPPKPTSRVTIKASAAEDLAEILRTPRPSRG